MIWNNGKNDSHYVIFELIMSDHFPQLFLKILKLCADFFIPVTFRHIVFSVMVTAPAENKRIAFEIGKSCRSVLILVS